MMIGAARRESSHVLCMTIVFFPPMNISDVYSSIALLESPTYGTYLITTCKSKSLKLVTEGERERTSGYYYILFHSLHTKKTVFISIDDKYCNHVHIIKKIAIFVLLLLSLTHTVVWVLPRKVKNIIGLHHVVHHIALTDFLAPKLLWS